MASLIRAATTRINPSISLPTALFVACRGIATRLFVGGLSFCTTEDGLSHAFSQHGQVIEAKIVTDKVTEKSKGFGFVTFASEDEAASAITAMDRQPLNGRVIYVNYARPKVDRGGGIPIARGPPKPINIEELKEGNKDDTYIDNKINGRQWDTSSPPRFIRQCMCATKKFKLLPCQLRQGVS